MDQPQTESQRLKALFRDSTEATLPTEGAVLLFLFLPVAQALLEIILWVCCDQYYHVPLHQTPFPQVASSSGPWWD